jgi:hypothetical protein
MQKQHVGHGADLKFGHHTGKDADMKVSATGSPPRKAGPTQAENGAARRGDCSEMGHDMLCPYRLNRGKGGRDYDRGLLRRDEEFTQKIERVGGVLRGFVVQQGDDSAWVDPDVFSV